MSEMTVAEQVEEMLSQGLSPDLIRAKFPDHGEIIDNVLGATERDAPGSVAPTRSTGSDDEDDAA
ncbi:MAG: hypothetical protein IT290_07430 [Deltaproteobacteria bacterium]|nr:hypothetical protein [Deltaproteobacteria bacterium]